MKTRTFVLSALAMLTLGTTATAQTRPAWETEEIQVVVQDFCGGTSDWSSLGVRCYEWDNGLGQHRAVWTIPAGLINWTNWGADPYGNQLVYPITLGRNGHLYITQQHLVTGTRSELRFNALYQNRWIVAPTWDGVGYTCRPAHGPIFRRNPPASWARDACVGQCNNYAFGATSHAVSTELVAIFIGGRRYANSFERRPYPIYRSDEFDEWYGYHSAMRWVANGWLSLPTCDFVFHPGVSEPIDDMPISFWIRSQFGTGSELSNQLDALRSGSLSRYLRVPFPWQGTAAWDQFCTDTLGDRSAPLICN